MFNILGTDDSVNTCDCCGKTNLKFTVVVENESGEILHYGCVCATRHTKYTNKEIKQKINEVEEQAKAEYDRRLKLAENEFLRSVENINLKAKMNAAHKTGLVGVAFKKFCEVERAASDVKERELIEKYNLTNTKYL